MFQSTHVHVIPSTIVRFVSLDWNRLLYCSTQSLFIPRYEPRPVWPRHRDQTRGIRVPSYRMAIHVIKLFDPEAIDETKKYEIQFTIGKQRACTHTIAQSVGLVTSQLTSPYSYEREKKLTNIGASGCSSHRSGRNFSASCHTSSSAQVSA